MVFNKIGKNCWCFFESREETSPVGVGIRLSHYLQRVLYISGGSTQRRCLRSFPSFQAEPILLGWSSSINSCQLVDNHMQIILVYIYILQKNIIYIYILHKNIIFMYIYILYIKYWKWHLQTTHLKNMLLKLDHFPLWNHHLEDSLNLQHQSTSKGKAERHDSWSRLSFKPHQHPWLLRILSRHFDRSNLPHTPPKLNIANIAPEKWWLED